MAFIDKNNIDKVSVEIDEDYSKCDISDLNNMWSAFIKSPIDLNEIEKYFNEGYSYNPKM